MITIEDFDHAAKALSKSVDSAAVLRQYHLYIKLAKSNPAEDINSFIIMRLPADTDVLINDIIRSIPCLLGNALARIQSFVKHRKYTVSDSVQGWFISKQAYDELEEFIHSAIPVLPLFNRICDIYGFPSDRITYCKTTNMLGKLIKKEHYHPCCEEVEFLTLPTEKAENMIFSALCDLLGTCSPSATLMSIESGADMLSIPPYRLMGWICSVEPDAWYQGSKLIPKALVETLLSTWKNTILINEQNVHILFPDIPVLLLKPLMNCLSKSKKISKYLISERAFPC